MPSLCYNVARGLSSDTVAMFLNFPASTAMSQTDLSSLKCTQSLVCCYNYKKKKNEPRYSLSLFCFLGNLGIESLRNINIDLNNSFRASELVQGVDYLSSNSEIHTVEEKN